MGTPGGMERWAALGSSACTNRSAVPTTENESSLGAASLHVIRARVGSSPDAGEYRQQNEPRQPSTAPVRSKGRCYRLSPSSPQPLTANRALWSDPAIRYRHR